jgi:hypothetical protein
MKTALCLYGQPRDVASKSGAIIEKVVIPNGCDVFYHGWYDPENLSMKKMTPGHEHRMISKNVDSYLQETYRPKKHKLEKQVNFFHKNFEATDENIDACWSYCKVYDRQTFVNDKSKCIHSMWYSIMQSLLLKDLYSHENNFVYDCVILSRYDVAPISRIDVSKYDLNKLITRNHDYPREEVCDWFMFANNDVMNIVASTYFYINRFYQDIKKSDVKIWTNEAFLRDILSNNFVEVEKGDYDVSF